MDLAVPIVTNSCRLLWLSATNCYTGVTPALIQLGLTRDSALALSSYEHWEASARQKRMFSVWSSSKEGERCLTSDLLNKILDLEFWPRVGSMASWKNCKLSRFTEKTRMKHLTDRMLSSRMAVKLRQPRCPGFGQCGKPSLEEKIFFYRRFEPLAVTLSHDNVLGLTCLSFV
ncbi:hypothetical protein AVEN_159879-1 [Araneus ventricosus]|uniref:Uncharacterized protein n=1 Tax=Araneus ventricosus TaxID=182803 RepID=A0A4Y2E577_ARAVE|nr:hypothetical protein AVEN_159879-1 [Araneus ventricosus]